MSERLRWRDAEQGAHAFMKREADRRTALLLTRLPLLHERAMEQLAGLRGSASAYRCLARLTQAGLIGAIRPRLQAGCSARLFYLTDLGLGAVALDQGVEPEHLGRRNRLRGRDLLALLPGLPQLVASYTLTAAIAASRPGSPDLLAWERPWRRRYQRPTSKAPVTVALPGYVALQWEDVVGAYLLIPDLATFPLRAYRSALDHLLVLRNVHGPDFPALVVATSNQRRASAWQELFEDCRRARREAPLAALVACWQDLPDTLKGLASLDVAGERHARLVRRIQGPRLRPRHPSTPLTTVVGDALASTVSGQAVGDPGRKAMGLTVTDRALLDLVSRHPFLSAESLAVALGGEVRWARRCQNRLIAQGLVRLVDAAEIGRGQARRELVELTVDGLEIVAAQQGLTLATAVRLNGLAGGGPEQPVGSRRKLLTNLAHTIGADELFIGLLRTARQAAAAGGDDALADWRNAAACSRRHLRPDGYGIYRRGGQLYGFFLEYDRGTMSARDYREKFAAYHHYRASGRFNRDYEGFPTILVVTSDKAAEERIAGAVGAVGVGQGPNLPLLLTCQWRIDDPRNPAGLLGPIWREPHAEFDDRRLWLLTPPQCTTGLASRSPSVASQEDQHSALTGFKCVCLPLPTMAAEGHQPRQVGEIVAGRGDGRAT